MDFLRELSLIFNHFDHVGVGIIPADILIRRCLMGVIKHHPIFRPVLNFPKGENIVDLHIAYAPRDLKTHGVHFRDSEIPRSSGCAWIVAGRREGGNQFRCQLAEMVPLFPHILLFLCHHFLALDTKIERLRSRRRRLAMSGSNKHQ